MTMTATRHCEANLLEKLAGELECFWVVLVGNREGMGRGREGERDCQTRVEKGATGRPIEKRPSPARNRCLLGYILSICKRTIASSGLLKLELDVLQRYSCP